MAEAFATPGFTRVSGIVQRVRFQNPATGWFAIEISGAGGQVTVMTGLCAVILAPDFSVAANGQMVAGKYGPEFRAVEVEASPPRTDAGIRKYLASGLFRGISTRMADSIVDHFGDLTLQVLDHEPNRLSEVPKLGPKKRETLIAAWRRDSELRQFTLFALSAGLTMRQIQRIHSTYGDEAAATIKADPYRLYRDIEGVGFRTADVIARKMQVAFDSPLRIRACLRFVLQEATQDGHCALPGRELLAKCQEALQVPDPNNLGSSLRVEIGAIRAQVRLALEAKDLTLDYLGNEPCVFLPWLHACEDAIAHHLVRIANSPARDTPTIAVMQVLLANALAETRLVLAPEQEEAVRQALQQKIVVITGGPGVGKTTITRVLLSTFRARGWSTVLCAPTGKAAKRMAESTGFEAKTVHRLLEYTGDNFTRDGDSPLEVDAVFADEFSMHDVWLAYALLDAMPDHARLVIIGDVDQLPSIGPGNVLGDIIASGAVRVVRLTRVYRQAEHSAIIRAAHAINAGDVPAIQAFPGNEDLSLVSIESNEECVPATVATIRALLEQGVAPSDIQVIIPMHKGPAGAGVLNEELRQLLRVPVEPFSGSIPSDDPRWTPAFAKFSVGDRVIQGHNAYALGIFNGDIGVVQGLVETVEEDQAADTDDDEVRLNHQGLKVRSKLRVAFFQGPTVDISRASLEALRPAYAITIHKSQGSEFPVLVMPLCKSHFVMLQRRLFYTGLTRGKRQVVLVAQPSAMKLATSRNDAQKRNTRLAQCIRHLCK